MAEGHGASGSASKRASCVPAALALNIPIPLSRTRPAALSACAPSGTHGLLAAAACSQAAASTRPARPRSAPRGHCAAARRATGSRRAMPRASPRSPSAAPAATPASRRRPPAAGTSAGSRKPARTTTRYGGHGVPWRRGSGTANVEGCAHKSMEGDPATWLPGQSQFVDAARGKALLHFKFMLLFLLGAARGLTCKKIRTRTIVHPGLG
eukprot:scaffold33464_cov107-Isochrysis_galbana.AAC.1